MKIVLMPEEKAAKKAAKKAAWLATPVAIVQRPLRYLRSQLNAKDEKGNTLVHPVCTVAKRMAKRGDGGTIQAMALYIAHGGLVAPIVQETEEPVAA
jgi:hypothetical protein